MPYKRKHPALVQKKCEVCGVLFWVTSVQMVKRRCGDRKDKTGCSQFLGREAQKRFRKSHPEITLADNKVWNYSRQLERARTRIKKYAERYGREVVIKWLTPPTTEELLALEKGV